VTGNGLVLIQAPPHGAVVGQTMVGVHVEPVGQGPLFPIVQGISGGRVCGVKQRPPQVCVGVQVEPVGQGSPERMHVDREGFGTLCEVARVRDETISRLRDSMLVENELIENSGCMDHSGVSKG